MRYQNIILRVAIVALVALAVHSCANRASGPQGGIKDENPPKVVKEIPLNGALNYQNKKVEVTFDELVLIENMMENVLISPPQRKLPEVKASGRKITVNFLDDLRDSTTYTIGFGNAIVDNNEKNVLSGYTFSFATGDVIDSLRLSGVVVDAQTLNPISGILVGIHANHTDTIFKSEPFLRVDKTNAEGRFTIRNTKGGSYRVWGLQDSNRDYIHQPGEGLAFSDSIWIPSSTLTLKKDTVRFDSLLLDSVAPVYTTEYFPNNLLLRYFKESKVRQYYVKNERPKAHYFQLYFNTAADSVPRIEPIGEAEERAWFDHTLIQSNATNDTITVWLTDSIAIGVDTIRFALSYLKSDSLYELQPQTDTIRSLYRRPRAVVPRGSRRASETPPMEFLKLTHNLNNSYDIYKPIVLQTETPVARFVVDSMRLFEVVDTILKPLQYKFGLLDSVKMNYKIEYKWEAEKKYELQIDSAAITDIYGIHNNELSQQFKIKSLDEYSTLAVVMEQHNPKAVIQMLDSKDAVVRELPARTPKTLFEYMKPDDYYLRLFIDENGDGKWTTGDFEKRLQPEEVYYYPYKLTLRANWEFEEKWNHLERPLLEQKPKELIPDNTKKK